MSTVPAVASGVTSGILTNSKLRSYWLLVIGMNNKQGASSDAPCLLFVSFGLTRGFQWYFFTYVLMSKKEPVDRRTKEPVYSQSSRGGFYLTQISRIFTDSFFASHRSHESHRGCVARSARSVAAAPSVHTPEDTYKRSDVCSVFSFCVRLIIHSVRKKQSKFCLNSVDKNRFVTIRVIRGQFPPRGGFYLTQISRIFMDSLYSSTRI